MQFNKTVGKTKTAKNVVANMEGGKAFKPSEKLEFILRAATTVAKMDTFYATGEASNKRFVELIRNISRSEDPELALKGAWYTRNRFNMRTPATVILAEAIYAGAKDIPNGSDYVAKTINRVDDMTELLAYCMMLNKHYKMERTYLPMAIKRGLAKAFVNFDSYQFAKYTKDGMMIKPRDVMFLSHPKPREGQVEMFRNIIDGTLPIPETWETYISINGSTKENWTHILDAMGYLGIIRNLRNLMKHGVDTNDICAEIVDPGRTRRSRMFPVQFYTAYRQIEKLDYKGVEKVKAALSDAMTISAENMELIPGKTAVFCDNSGSMDSSINPKSTVSHKDIGNVFGAMVASRSDDCKVYAFGSDVVRTGINPRDSILTNVDKILSAGNRAGGSTYTGRCISTVERDMPDVDRIIFFTDEQGYGRPSCYDALNAFRKKTGNNPFVYTFDLIHYGTTQFPENERKHCTVGGWADNSLRFLNLYEMDGTTLVDEVDAVNINTVR
jgi:60 kDa SS-A/Ro ribonucleoprotein